MPVFQKDGKRILFVHVPKAGGTTVEQFFLANGWSMSLFDSGEEENTLNPVRKCSPQHWHFETLQSIFRLANFKFVFCIVRHPMTRIISEYRWRRQHFGLEKSFDEWVDFALKSYSNDNFSLDNHIRPQFHFVGPGMQIFKLEDGIDNCINDLKQRGIISAEINMPRRAMVSSGELVEPGPQAMDMIMRFYAQDFQRFGYV
ncbi:sulfotransferase family 2 domain-containing protein [Rhodobacterales bacterium LSUCC0031]|nr:sulfotransferase family 2 domain-containing protein [Rhodobacterales bacterium LSUCC0031]